MMNNAEKTQLTIPRVRRSCSNCQFFQHEEVGDSDYGAVYSDVATCQKYLDTDPKTEEDIPNFDREIERDCCELDFWKVVELDDELSEKLVRITETLIMPISYLMNVTITPNG